MDLSKTLCYKVSDDKKCKFCKSSKVVKKLKMGLLKTNNNNLNVKNVSDIL